MRHNNRANDQLRHITIETGVSPYAEGSCLIKCGNTHVLCNASIETRVPRFIHNTGSGWVTAEYGMLPRSTHSRMNREASSGKQGGRTVEIQRLIGRSLRAAVDLKALGERQITIDCDVLNADGGTRTASITGAFVALSLACEHLVQQRLLAKSPIIQPIAATSCGIVNGEARLDLDYNEDSTAQADSNFILADNGGIVEIQGTAEGAPFSQDAFMEMLTLAQKGVAELVEIQRKALQDERKEAV